MNHTPRKSSVRRRSGDGSPASRHGFTLVELLVVIGIIALLISILLPTLGKARRAATALQCASNMRTIMQGVMLYANAYQGTFPGSPWTSGAHVRTSADPADFDIPGVAHTATDNNCPDVITIWDWVSPVAKQLGIPFDAGASNASRQSRFLQFLKPGVFMCPDNAYIATAFGADNWGSLPAMSYTTCVDFMLRNNHFPHLTSDTTANNRVGYFVTRPEWDVPSGYTPKISKVGNAAEKVYLSEGSRFVDTTLAWTYNAQVSGVQLGGSHSDQRPYVALSFNRSRLFVGHYGDPNATSNAGDGRFLLLAYRHGTRAMSANVSAYRMNCAFFDGHVESVDALASLDPKLWSPRGTNLNITTAQVYPVVVSHFFGGTPRNSWICP